MPYSDLRDKKNQLIRKARDGSVFIAPYSAPTITTLTTGASSDLTPLPAGFEDLGWTTTDGVTFGRNTDLSDINSFGSIEPTRSDVTRDTITMQAAAQETKMLSIGLSTGADVSGVTPNATTGEVSVAKPARPGFLYYRVFGLFVDDSDAGEIYMARYMPRARVTAIAEQKFTSGDTAVEYNVTFTGYEDSVLGYSHKWLWGGPGWKAITADMGF